MKLVISSPQQNLLFDNVLYFLLIGKKYSLQVIGLFTVATLKEEKE